VNLAARLQGLAPSNEIVVADATKRILAEQVEFEDFDEITPKGFSRLVKLYLVKDFKSDDHRDQRPRFSHRGKYVEINVFDTTDIRAAIEELQLVEQAFESRLEKPNPPKS
jgi:adenylate cyclase